MPAANIVATAVVGPPLVSGRYTLGARLGAGASGETFAATDASTGDACVIKVFSAGAAARASAIAEFRGLQTLAHPSIVRVRDVGCLDDGRVYLATDRIAGPGLDTIASMADDEARRKALARAARDLADALAHLHARGIVHADVCPANVRFAEPGGASRAVLLDFGLAGPPSPGDGAARGTLGYAAPEALTGARTPAVDLFALGATLFEAFSGGPPFGRGLPAVQRMLAGSAPLLSSIRPGLGEAWDALFARLLAADPASRPSSARELLREVLRISAGNETPTEIDLAIPHPEGDPLAGIVVGRQGERAALRGALDRLAEGTASTSSLALVGAPGSGRRTLFERVAADVAVAAAAGVMPAIDVWRGDVEALERWLGQGLGPTALARPELDENRAAQARHARLAEALEARAGSRPLCVWLDEGPAASAFAAFWSGAPPSGRVLIVSPLAARLGRPFEEEIVLQAFAEEDIAALIGAGGDIVPEPEAVRAVARAAQGNAALAAILTRRLIESVRSGGGQSASIEPGADLDRLLARGFAALPADAQKLLFASALVGDEAPAVAELDAEAAARGGAAARAAGWLEIGLQPRGFGAARLPSSAHRRAVLAASDTGWCGPLAARALSFLDENDPRRPDALVAAGQRAAAAALLRSTAATAAARGGVTGAALLLERSRAVDPTSPLDSGEGLLLATGLALLGRYEEAAAALAAARAVAVEPVARAACVERDAWLRTRRGDLEGARAALEGGLTDPELNGAGLRARLGRLLVTMGRFREALAAVQPMFAEVAAVEPAARALGTEAAVLAHAYLGEPADARARLASLERMRVVSDGRRAYLAAMTDQLAGDEGRALAAYRRAYELSSSEGDVHTVAAVALNLGGLLAEQGLYGEALGASERAVRELGRLGAAADLTAALVNAANLFVAVGDLPAARRALDRARAGGAGLGATLAAAPAQFVEGDLACRAGQPQDAVVLYRAAATAYLDGGQPHHAVAALASAAEAWALCGRADQGRRTLNEAQAVDLLRNPEEDPCLRARGLLTLADGGDDPAAVLAQRIESAARAARAAGRRPRAWRLAVVAARLADRGAGPAAARSALELARSIFEEVRMATPEHHRAGLARDPDAAWLSGGTGAGNDGPVAARAIAAEGKMRRLLRINKRLNSELRLPRLLEMIVDTVIELTDAERGFLLLEDESGALAVKVARNIDQQTLGTADFELSRSIARQAAVGGEPIVTIDAAGDARFREAMSVSDLHLRSVLAVPLVIKGRAAGTIYVDHRLRKGAFDQEDVRLVLDFAEQAAIAVENARLLGELRRRERQVEALNRRLEVELAARREELSGIKQELRDNREALAVRYDYRNIVGRTPRMLELFRLLDRITDTTLPVVIQGESGTGKELVARAIHANGPRRDRPFVGENCAAIPETLLESTLFGYVRGAFTGAEHDTRGLFEIADGGTLFLDEVGEMSPAMQGKLLRVLQEGELRRVGSERTRKVDVRIVTATNRDLARMVEERKFRQDLYFRLNVAQISLPPLRDRRDDIPLMMERFLAKQAAAAGRPPKIVEPAALARLISYRWPGNVRELENEITRADALSGERITAADLSPQVAAAADAGAVAAAADPDNLQLRPRVERLERSLLREALGRSGNNQTKAAELLGLSRFGLQKKLRRYNFA